MESSSPHGGDEVLAHLGRQFAPSPGSYEPSCCETEVDQGYPQLYLNNSLIETIHLTYPPPGPHTPTAYPVQSNHGSGFNSVPTYARVASTHLYVNANSPVRLLDNHNLASPHRLYGPSLLAPSTASYNQAPRSTHGRLVPGPQQHAPWPQQVQPIFYETPGSETRVAQHQALHPSSQHSFSPTDRNLIPTNPTYADVVRMPDATTFVPCPAQEVPTPLYHSRYLSHVAASGASSFNTGHGRYLAPRSQPSGRKREYQRMCDEHQGLLPTPACDTRQDQTLPTPFVAQQTIHNNPRSVKDLVHEVSRGGHRGPLLETTIATGDGSGSNSTPISPSAVSTLSSSAQKRPRRTGASLSEVDDVNTERCATCGNCYPAKEMRRHKRNHGPKKQRAHHCDLPECDQAFLYPKDLRRHQQRDHGLGGSTPATSITCPHDCCAGRTFGRNDALMKHMRNFHHDGATSISPQAS